jgi:uncharacterized protein
VTVLPDANVLVALLVDDHVHHEAAEAWLAGSTDVIALVSALMAQPRHEFWPDDAAFDAVSLEGVIGHRQVSDAYLAHLARVRGGRLATFDQGLAKLHADVADLVAVR